MQAGWPIVENRACGPGGRPWAFPGAECREVIFRRVVAEIVEQQEEIEILVLAEAEGALQFHTRALDGRLGLNSFFNWTERHNFSPFCAVRPHRFDADQRPMIHAFTNWTSSVMVTSSPTRIPPVSSAAFQVRPKSLRSIFVVAVNPTRVLPHGSLAAAVGPSTVNTTLRVTPWIVRSPATASSPSLPRVMRVDLKESAGNFSTSKKSALLRCA